MNDPGNGRVELEPPLSAEEADLIWYAPAGGLSTSLLLVLFMDLGIVVLLVVSKLFLLAVALLTALALLLSFSLVNAAHLVGPGGVTIQRPFGTETHSWSEFRGWRRRNDNVLLFYADEERGQPLLLQTRGDVEPLAETLSKYLAELPADDEQGRREDARDDG